jgi:phage terminase large subunit-like protein
MTTKTTTSSTKPPAKRAAPKKAPAKKAAAPRRRSAPRPPKVLEDLLGLEAAAGLYGYLKTAEHDDGRLVYPALDEELAELIPPRFTSPPPNRATRRELGLVFDLNEADRFLRFCRKLRHIKGSKWAGKPLELDLWQVVYVAARLFGWQRADGTRLYRTLFLEVPRKNGKTTLSSAIALYALSADREPGAEVYAAAAARDQARQCFDPAVAMVKGSPALSKRLTPLQNAITGPKASTFRVLAGEQAADLQHGLNVHVAVVDELHIHKKRDLLDVLESGTGSREQPIIVIITTAGVDDPGSIYTEKRDYAEKVAKGELEDHEFLSVIYTIDEADDPFEETSWKKANPGYGRSLQPSYIAKMARQAKNSPAALNTFLRLHLNVRTGQVTRWLALDKWDRSGARWLYPDDEDLAGRVAYAGLDLASSTDLAALALVLPRWEVMAVPVDPDDPDGPTAEQEVEVLDVIVRAWTPADTLDDRARRDRAPYRQWVNDGWLLTSPGEVIDFDEIELEAFDLADTYQVERLHFDRWGSKQIIGHLRDGGLQVLEMGQGFASFSAPMKETERVILEGRLAHAGNPLLRWAVGALSVAQDSAGNIKPDRDKSTGRIDPFVALVMAVDAWSRDTRGESVYEERGVEAV